MNKIHLLTNPKHHWLLPGWFHLADTYLKNRPRVTVITYGNTKDFPLKTISSSNYDLDFIDRENYPAAKWSNGLIKFLTNSFDDWICLFLEDYWIHSHCDWSNVERVFDFLQEKSYSDLILRVDISGDRFSRKQAKKFTTYSGIDIFQTPSHTLYQMSYQAAIWNRKNLLRVLVANENPWQSELNGSKRLERNLPGMMVLGTKPLVKYRPVWRSKTQLLNLDKINPKQVVFMKRKGMI